MIRICFYNYGGGMLHVSRELEIDGEVDEYLIRHIPGLQLEATDSEADMDDNSIYYFSGKNEAEACGLAKELSHIPRGFGKGPKNQPYPQAIGNKVYH